MARGASTGKLRFLTGADAFAVVSEPGGFRTSDSSHLWQLETSVMMPPGSGGPGPQRSRRLNEPSPWRLWSLHRVVHLFAGRGKQGESKRKRWAEMENVTLGATARDHGEPEAVRSGSALNNKTSETESGARTRNPQGRETGSTETLYFRSLVAVCASTAIATLIRLQTVKRGSTWPDYLQTRSKHSHWLQSLS